MSGAMEARTIRPRLGTWLMLFYAPHMLKKLAEAGLDFVRLDMEHTPIDSSDVSDLVRAAKLLPLDICLRPSSGRPADLETALATGARRLYVPQVETAQQAEAVVNTVRELLPENQSVHLSVMLESGGAFDNIEDIAAVAGIDLLAMGPADLAQDLGIYGAPDEDDILDGYRYRLRDAARMYGKDWELGVWTKAAAQHWAREGCPTLTYMTDTSALREAYLPAIQAMRAVNEAELRP